MRKMRLAIQIERKCVIISFETKHKWAAREHTQKSAPAQRNTMKRTKV